jgi:hypothetical protein
MLGVLAQLGERLLCKQDVVGSNPSDSTKEKPCIYRAFCIFWLTLKSGVLMLGCNVGVTAFL